MHALLHQHPAASSARTCIIHSLGEADASAFDTFFTQLSLHLFTVTTSRQTTQHHYTTIIISTLILFILGRKGRRERLGKLEEDIGQVSLAPSSLKTATVTNISRLRRGCSGGQGDVYSSRRAVGAEFFRSARSPITITHSKLPAEVFVSLQSYPVLWTVC